MLNFGRSGGTVLNQCLALLPNTIVLSEVNKLGGGGGLQNFDNIKDQAANWYNIKLKSETFEEQILELAEYCQTYNKKLIIRDWVYINFVPTQKNAFRPSYELDTYLFLREHFDVNPFLLVRNTIDCWISYKMPEINSFIKDYKRFIEKVTSYDIPIFYYEQFVRSPSNELKTICASLNVTFKDVINKAPHYKNVNGDIQPNFNSRGQKGAIRPLKRKIIPFQLVKQVNSNEDFKRINTLLNYEPNYFSEINWFNYWIKRSIQILNRYL